MHPTDAELGALLVAPAHDTPPHGPRASAAVERHLAACAECAGRLAMLRREHEEAADLLRALDHPPPPLRADAVLARARRRRGVRIGPIAAGILLTAAAVAAALPGSPLRRTLADAVASWTAPTPARVAPGGIVPRAERPNVGVAVMPGASLDVRFARWQHGGTLRIMIADAPRALLVAPAGTAAFSVRQGQILVDNGDSATFTLTVPRTLPLVRVLVESTVVFRRSADVPSPALPPDGAYTVDLATPPRNAP